MSDDRELFVMPDQVPLLLVPVDDGEDWNEDNGVYGIRYIPRVLYDQIIEFLRHPQAGVRRGRPVRSAEKLLRNVDVEAEVRDEP